MNPEEKPVGSPWGGAVGSRLQGSRLKAGLKSGITANISKDLEAIRAAADAVDKGNDAAAKVREALDKFKFGGSAAQFRESVIPGAPGAQHTPPPGSSASGRAAQSKPPGYGQAQSKPGFGPPSTGVGDGGRTAGPSPKPAGQALPEKPSLYGQGPTGNPAQQSQPAYPQQRSDQRLDQAAGKPAQAQQQSAQSKPVHFQQPGQAQPHAKPRPAEAKPGASPAPATAKGGSIFDQLSWGDDAEQETAAPPPVTAKPAAQAAEPLQTVQQEAPAPAAGGLRRAVFGQSNQGAAKKGGIFDQLAWGDEEEEAPSSTPQAATVHESPAAPVKPAAVQPAAKPAYQSESPLAEAARAEAAERAQKAQTKPNQAAQTPATQKPPGAVGGPKVDLRGAAAPKRTSDRKKSIQISKLSMEVAKPSMEVPRPTLERPAPKGEEYFIHKIPGSEFFCRSRADGFITDFWMPEPGGKQANHFKWTGSGYRKYLDETKNYDAHSPAVVYPQASMDESGLAAQVNFGNGTSFLFHFDGRFEERDLQDRPLAERDSSGQQRTYIYKNDTCSGVSIKFADEPVCASFALQQGSLQPGTFVGYEYSDPKTGHQESLQLDDSYWSLSIGDRRYWFPKECTVKVDRYGTRRLATDTVVFYQGTPDGYSIIRNAAGQVIEVTTPDGVLNIFSRRPDGSVEQVVVINGQGQVVEHSTRTGERWDAAEVAKITIDDTSGVCSVFFAAGQEVRRHPDGTQELVGAAGDYCLDADRIAAFVPLAGEEKRQMLADLACISRLPMESQSWIYNAVWELANAVDTPTELTDEQRRSLILSLTHQLAHPEDIRQGYKDTAVAAVAEKALAMLRPDLYADMLSKLAAAGEYTAANGVHLVAQRRKDGKLADYSDSSGARSLTSEILQTTLMRRVMPKGQEYRSYPAGHEPVPYGVERSTDAGERIISEGKESRFTGPPKDALYSMLSMLTPEATWVSVPILSPSDLDNAWRSSGCTPPMPVSVRIDIPDPTLGSVPFTHSVLITNLEYDANGVPQKVYFENTADGEDHSYPGGTGVAIKDFVRSMQVRNSSVITGTETVIPAVALVRTAYQ